MSIIVAIDGPSGSGKSSVARALARRFGLAYLDTGAMYRLVTVALMRSGQMDWDGPGVEEAVRFLIPRLEVGTNPDVEHFGLLDPEVDLTEAIRSPAVSAVVSRIATNLPARAHLVAAQQAMVKRLAGRTGVVLEGRDTTTVIAPDADVRVLLTASEAARLRRRSLQDSGSEDVKESTRDQVLRRDRDDSKASNFMTASDGVLTLDSSNLTLEETIETLAALVEKAA